MSVNEIKHAVRMLEFPQSAREALIRIEQVLVGRTASGSSKQLDIARDLIAEFVFCETDRHRNRRSGPGLNPLQELQLIDVICDYLSACTNDATKNSVFLSLFDGMESQRRLKILSILASMAVSASSTPVLLAVGVWLQQMGCSSPQSLQLVENIIQDHFYLNTSNQNSLKSLANTAPQFVSNFITAVTELYMHDASAEKLPPKNLLEVVTSWVYSNPSLCMSAQLNPPPLPVGCIPMAAVTPLAGLIRWCALAPLRIDEDAEMVEIEVPMKKIKLEGVKEPVKSAIPTKALTESELYVKLQLGVLHALRAGRRLGGPPTAVNAQHLAALVPHVHAHARVPNPATHPRVQDCLDRIGQSVQVALANGCIYGNISNLLAVLNTLPENRLLRIIIRTHQQTI
ncbi:hypothetical protein NE865_13996 [Phthorimaea operculella]|nr:hypothetical protein NE865_13996 [Phthorimaea operculella]